MLFQYFLAFILGPIVVLKQLTQWVYISINNVNIGINFRNRERGGGGRFLIVLEERERNECGPKI